ncbi:MFS transporter [Actinoplanes sp. LDG1-06]|uniref:MFS transporter n=2 Tax=Paractinoplanes ovalisporus TaxID=2810368 RepID=A0ABS2AJW4_9ACTN|nr:MFS transporter [Actinoplanes ovalisporus]
MAGRREWIALAVLCFPTLLTTVDVSVLILALPRIAADLDMGVNAQLWSADIYGFMLAGFIVLMGTLGDRIGHKKVLLTGAAVFIVASAVAAYAGSTWVLLGARGLLGIAAATVMPSVLALISRMFPNPAQMGVAMGVWGTSIMLGVILGPVVGGLLLGWFWWGSIFLIGIPVMLLLLVLGPKLLPETANPEAGRLDVVSALISLAALLPFVYGLKEVARAGWAATPVALMVIGVAFAVLFVQRQRTLAVPMVDLGLFRIPAVGSTILLGLGFGFIMGGIGLVTTLYMQLVEGMTPVRVAVWMLIPSFAMIIGGNVGPLLARKIKPGWVLSGGLVIASVGTLIMTRVSLAGGLTTLIIGLVVMYLGASPVGTLANAVMMTNTPPEKAGAAGSLSSTGGELGVALGVALLGSAASAVYGNSITLPDGLPPEVAAPAGESIAAASAIAGTLPGPVGGQLLDAAQDAFTSALHGVTFLTTLVFLVLAAMLAIGLRRVQPLTGPPGMPHGDMPPAAEEPATPAPVRDPV